MTKYIFIYNAYNKKSYSDLISFYIYLCKVFYTMNKINQMRQMDSNKFK